MAAKGSSRGGNARRGSSAKQPSGVKPPMPPKKGKGTPKGTKGKSSGRPPVGGVY